MVLFIDGANVCASVGECIPDTPQVNPLSTPLSKLPEEEEKEQHTPVPSFSPSSSPSQQHTETEITPGEGKEACVEPNSQQSLSQQEMLEAAVVASESARQVWKQRDGKSREWLYTMVDLSRLYFCNCSLIYTHSPWLSQILLPTMVTP